MAAAVAVAQLGCSGTQARQVGCSKDTDCKDPRVCERGVCVDPHPVGTSASLVKSEDTDVPSATPVKGPPAFAMFGGDARHSGRRGGPAPIKQPTELWKVDVKGVIAGSPTIGPDGTIYVSSHDSSLYAIDPKGSIKWSFKTADRSWSAPAVARDGTIYIGSDDDHLYAVKADGTIYVGSDDHTLYAISPKGDVVWRVITGGDIRGGAAIANDGTIYVGSYDKKLYAIAPNGRVQWKLAAADKIQSTPGIATNGIILFGAQDEHVYAVAPDGTLRWHLALPGDVDSTPAIASDGTLYVAGDDGHLHAFR